MSNAKYDISLHLYFSSPTHLLKQMDALRHVLGNAKQIKHINNLRDRLHDRLLYYK